MIERLPGATADQSFPTITIQAWPGAVALTDVIVPCKDRPLPSRDNFSPLLLLIQSQGKHRYEVGKGENSFAVVVSVHSNRNGFREGGCLRHCKLCQFATFMDLY